MKPSDVAIIALSTECRINNDDSDSEPVTYGEGTGDADGACEDEYVEDNLGVYDPFPGTNTIIPFSVPKFYRMLFQVRTSNHMGTMIS